MRGPWEPFLGFPESCFSMTAPHRMHGGIYALKSLLIDTIPDRPLSGTRLSNVQVQRLPDEDGWSWSHVTPLTSQNSPSDQISGFQKCVLLPSITIGGRNSQTLGSKSQSEATNLRLCRLDCIADAPSIVCNPWEFSHGG